MSSVSSVVNYFAFGAFPRGHGSASRCRQREQLKREVLRLAAQGRSLLPTQGWREKNGWWEGRRREKLHVQLPAWLVERLEIFRRVPATLTAERAAATRALEKAAPAARPKGLGGLTYEVVERAVGDWGRFDNRRPVGRSTGRCGGVSASGKSTHLLPSPNTATCGCARRWSNRPGGWWSGHATARW